MIFEGVGCKERLFKKGPKSPATFIIFVAQFQTKYLASQFLLTIFSGWFQQPNSTYQLRMRLGGRYCLLFVILFAFLFPSSSSSIWEQRAQQVRNAIKEAWNSYRSLSFYDDDLRPLTKTGFNWLQVRATLYDSLDTLYLAGLMVLDSLSKHFHLQDEYRDAVEEIRRVGMPETSPFYLSSSSFEYHIRCVGGLLGAYSLTGDEFLLYVAKDAADALLYLPFLPSVVFQPAGKSAHPWVSLSVVVALYLGNTIL